MNNPVVSVVIGSYQRNGFIQLAIDSIRHELRDVDHEIIVVDGGSSDGSLEWLITQKDIITVTQHNRGIWNDKPVTKRSWGYFMNLGFKIAQGKYICMISDDCIVIPKSITNGIHLFEHYLNNLNLKIGAVAFYWRNWPNQIDYVVGQTWGDKIFVNHGLFLNSALKDVNYIDEESYSFYHADGDLSLRLWDKGYICIDSPTSFVEHFIDPSETLRINNLTSQPEDWKTYTNKWMHKYGPPSLDWLTMDYQDPSRAADQFNKAIKKPLKLKLPTFQSQINKVIVRLKGLKWK